ncbi:TOMM precursor leader peptide-binding protein [Micromonospora sp. NBC_01740]|uniref:TOMM precursor leader peptide-binding protein n=1 Tax=Micromonospora sp. NBC_01740 TaxID=2975986 RepID=UPI002E0F70FE|nr:TOMM precursor leader peptide-binding protein [Micromonospora sp. NBC_01740]
MTGDPRLPGDDRGGPRQPDPDLAGQLAEALRGAGSPYPVLAEDDGWAGSGPAVVVSTRWSPALLSRLADRGTGAGGTVLPVRFDGGTALVGPLVGADSATCLRCLEAARLAAPGGRTPHGDAELRLGGRPAPALLPVLAAVVRSALAEPQSAAARLWVVPPDGSVSAHPVAPVGVRCEGCLSRQPPAPPGTPLTGSGQPPADPLRLRRPNPATDLAGLRRALLEPRLGHVVQLHRHEGYGLPVTRAVVAGPAVTVAGFGRATTAAEADRLALFEAVERLAGYAPHGPAARQWSSFAELGPERAVDPAALGLPDLPSAHHIPYAPDVPTWWVPGWSPSRATPVAVPEHAAYWGDLGQRPSVTFLSESSNGCGLGNSLEEAALHGLFEVIERDAFLMAWYARTPLVEVALPDELDLVGHLADNLDLLDYDLRLFDATTDLAVPAVVALAHHRMPAVGAPTAFFAAGAHLDPLSAIHSAVVELVVNLHEVRDTWQGDSARADRDRLLPMLDDAALVRQMDDHMMLHCLPEARPRYEFLLGAGRTRAWREVWPGLPRPVEDLAALFGALCADLHHRAGVEPVVVDQSIPELRQALGLHAAKVVVPGTLPMTFGHLNRRTRGLPRLLTVPAVLGRLPGRPRYEDLALHPHPFP